MLTRFGLLTVWLFVIGGSVLADEKKPFKAKISIRGVINEKDSEALRAVLKKLPGIKVDTDAVGAGEKGPFGHYFSPPFVIEFTDSAKTNLGAVGKAIAEARTSSREDLPPSLNLVLFAANGMVGEGEISAVREALGEVNGMAVREPGGTVGDLKDASVRVRLDDSGSVTLDDILAALKKAELDVRLEKP